MLHLAYVSAPEPALTLHVLRSTLIAVLLLSFRRKLTCMRPIRISRQDSHQLRQRHGPSRRCEHQWDTIQFAGYDLLRELPWVRVSSCVWYAIIAHCKVLGWYGCSCEFISAFLPCLGLACFASSIVWKLRYFRRTVGRHRRLYLCCEELGWSCHYESSLGRLRERCRTKSDAHHYDVV